MEAQVEGFYWLYENSNGAPLKCIIVHLKKKKEPVRHQLKGATLRGSQFQTDNFKVSQFLESVVVAGSTNIENHVSEG
jgi:hypothetical protein